MTTAVQQNASGGHRELIGLTAWRGIAAVLVVLFHLDAVFSERGYGLALGPFERMIERSYIFVDLFFILSGFVIAHVYGQRRLLERGEMRRFVALRLGRIYPLHLFVVALLALRPVAALLTGTRPVFTQGSSGRALITELLLLDSIGLHDSLTWNDVSWSISAEWISYLLAPVLLLLMRKDRVSVWMIGAVIGVLWVGIYLVADETGSLDNAPYRLGWIRGLLSFTLGICAYRLSGMRWVGRTFARRGSVTIAAFAVVVVCIVAPHDAILVPFFVALIFASITSSGREASVLSGRPLRWLGDVSYSTYLLQQIFLLVMLKILAPIADDLNAVGLWAMTVGWVAGLLAVATLSYRCIEVPARDAVRARVHRDRGLSRSV